MARKKKVSEEQYEVELTKQTAGQDDITTKDVDAQDTATAMQQAKQGDANQYDQVIVKKKATRGGPATAPVSATPARAVSATTVESKGKRKPAKKKVAKKKVATKKRASSKPLTDPNSFELTEGYKNTRFDYKYAIVLPVGYKSFMEKMSGKTPGIVIVERMGRVQTQVHSPEAMDSLIQSLIKSAKGRIVENKDKARVIIKGIMGSVKR